jgi:hypothetical protein
MESETELPYPGFELDSPSLIPIYENRVLSEIRIIHDNKYFYLDVYTGQMIEDGAFPEKMIERNLVCAKVFNDIVTVKCRALPQSK